MSADPNGPEPRHTFGVVAMDPVSQRLPVHPTQRGRGMPGLSFQDQRQGQQPPHLGAIILNPAVR
jgi:hypothetical protein